MTSQQLWDTQKSSSVLPEARPVAQSSHASHTSSGSRQQPQQQQVFIDLTQTDQEGPAEEPPAKRQKFDLSLSLPGNLSLPANNIPRGPLNAPSPLPSTPLRTPRPALPVRGKPTWDYQSPQSDEEDLSPHSPDSFSVIDRHVPTPPPLPQRPWSHRATRNVATPAPVARPALPVVIVPYVSEPRGVAPDCGNKKLADFVPWKGCHPEDSITDTAAKQGFTNRSQLGAYEANSARQSLGTSLRQTNALNLLSCVFVSALEQRQTKAKVTAPNTFKLPPRVTLTGVRRDAWLSDLANPEVPLRKLSRTVPYGVNGTNLLEHCASKRVEISRAVWFIKCVGAIDIRMFKRRAANALVATGMETKVSRDWTISLIQFFESLVAESTEIETKDGDEKKAARKDWTDKMAYSAELTRRMYEDGILDSDKILDWMVTSIERCTMKDVPVWLLVVETNWVNITRYRRFGKNITDALMNLLVDMLPLRHTPGHDRLFSELSALLQRLLASSSSCFLSPQKWATRKFDIYQVIEAWGPTSAWAFGNVEQRNERFITADSSGAGKTGYDLRQTMLKEMLDNPVAMLDFGQIYNLLRDMMRCQEDGFMLLLEWATTRVRENSPLRFYIATKLLQTLQSEGLDPMQPLIKFVQAVNTALRGVDEHLVYKLISELARTRDFSVSKYLHWVNSSGLLTVDTIDPKWGLLDARLVTQLPTFTQAEHLTNMRRALLKEAGVDVSAEKDDLVKIKNDFYRLVPDLFTKTPGEGMTEPYRLEELSWTFKSALCSTIRKQVTITKESLIRESRAEDRMTFFSYENFSYVRNWLERLGDQHSLLDCFISIAAVADRATLIALADAVHWYIPILDTLRFTQRMINALMSGLTRIKAVGMTDIVLVRSLTEAARLCRASTSVIANLAREALAVERKLVMAVCSPEADTESSDVQSTLLEIQQHVSTNVSLDDSTMTRWFRFLAEMMQSVCHKPESEWASLAYLSASLRTFNVATFDSVMVSWLRTLMKPADRDKLQKVVAMLVCVRCLSLEVFVKYALVEVERNALEFPDEAMAYRKTFEDLAHIISPVIKTGDGPNDFIPYRYYASSAAYTSSFPADVIKVSYEAVRAASTHEGDTPEKGTLINAIVNLLKEHLPSNETKIWTEFAEPLLNHSPSAASLVERITRKILFPAETYPPEPEPPKEGVRRAMQVMSELTTKFCHLRVKVLFALSGEELTRDEAVLEMFIHHAKSHIAMGSPLWVGMVQSVGREVGCLIREAAEKDFLGLNVCIEKDPDEESTMSQAEACFLLMKVLSHTLPSTPNTILATNLVEKMGSLHELQLKVQDPDFKLYEDEEADEDAMDEDDETEPETEVKWLPATLRFWFKALLSLSYIYRDSLAAIGTLNATTTSAALNAPTTIPRAGTTPDLPRLLLLITSLLQNHDLHNTILDTDLMSWGQDVLAVLTDYLNAEGRSFCIRILEEKFGGLLALGPEVRWAFGFGRAELGSMAGAAQNLRLRSQRNGAGTATGATSGGGDGEGEITAMAPGVPFPFRPWEMIEESVPNVGVNDTPIGLEIFGARILR